MAKNDSLDDPKQTGTQNIYFSLKLVAYCTAQFAHSAHRRQSCLSRAVTGTQFCREIGENRAPWNTAQHPGAPTRDLIEIE